eukprot:gb/GEZN01015471.1/.p1 GENE.gb/GEZN01015471.1/~~gb/GEZN01015471.1/.p1  ORF type:complete len:137 (-),score=7.40 gb/GEZN01015471.1/:179-589(-)
MFSEGRPFVSAVFFRGGAGEEGRRGKLRLIVVARCRSGHPRGVRGVEYIVIIVQKQEIRNNKEDDSEPSHKNFTSIPTAMCHKDQDRDKKKNPDLCHPSLIRAWEGFCAAHFLWETWKEAQNKCKTCTMEKYGVES